MSMSSDLEIQMTSSKPYLLRAFYEWIVDNECTPYLVVNAEYPQVKVPVQYIEEGKIILNVAEVAVKNLFMDNEAVSFSARFSGRALDVYIPIQAVIAIYARENGRGMVFSEEEHAGSSAPPGNPPTELASKKGSTVSLHAVGGSEMKDEAGELHSDDPDADQLPPDDGGSDPKGGSGKPSLHIVK